MDLATALDLSLEGQQEAKFNALRSLHGKKIKQLMLSIEAKEKEVAKLKVLSKDSRRTQMIQALRNKIKDMELTMDVMKEEIGKAREVSRSPQEVNDFIIRKTVGGPKRFRPLTREEMENKIIDLEKRVAKGAGRGAGNVSAGPSVSSQARSISGARDALANIAGRRGINVNSDGPEPESNGGAQGEASDGGLSKVAQLMEEINGLRSALDVSAGNCELQKEEVARLRKRNSDLAADCEELNFLRMQIRDMEASKADQLDEMALVQRKMAEIAEENGVLKTNSHTELEQAQAELDALQTHCEKLLAQNASLLKKLGDMEEELDAAHHQSGMASMVSKQATAGSSAAAQHAQELEKKLTRATDKLKQSELLIASLQSDNAQIMNLKSQLREKNNQIKEQAKQLSELSSRENSISPLRGVVGNGSPSSLGPSAKGRPGPLSLSTDSAGGGAFAAIKDQNDVITQLKSKLKDTEAENERLGQALTAAQRRLELQNNPVRS